MGGESDPSGHHRALGAQARGCHHEGANQCARTPRAGVPGRLLCSPSAPLASAPPAQTPAAKGPGNSKAKGKTKGKGKKESTAVKVTDSKSAAPSAPTSIVVRNSGQTLVRFEFRAKPEGLAPFPSWLVISPSAGEIPPGQSTTLQLHMGIFAHGQAHNSDGHKLPPTGPSGTADGTGDDAYDTEVIEDFLILHVEHGRDYYIPLTATLSFDSFSA